MKKILFLLFIITKISLTNNLDYIIVKSDVYTKKEVLSIHPSIEKNGVISKINNEMVNENELLKFDYIYGINDNGRKYLIIEDLSNKKKSIILNLDLMTNKKIIKAIFKKNNLFFNDKVNINFIFDLNNVNANLGIDYNKYDYVNNTIYSLGLKYSDEIKFNFGIKKILESKDEKNLNDSLSLNSNIYYIIDTKKNDIGYYFDLGFKYAIKKNPNIINESETKLIYLNKNNNNLFFISNNTKLRNKLFSLNLNTDFDTIISLKNISDNELIFIKENNNELIDNYRGIYLFNLKNELETAKVLGTIIYLFNDLLILGKYSENVIINDRLGMGLKYEKGNFRYQGHIGISINNNKRKQFIAGLTIGLEY